MALINAMHLRTGLALAVLACAWCALPLLSGAQPTTTSPALTPSEGDSQQPLAAAVAPAASTTTTAISAATATTAAATTPGATVSKKIPLAAPHEVFEPAAEVASALPVPIPETFPSASGLGFDPEGYGGQSVPGGGLGGFNGGPGGGFGSNGGFGGYCCGGPGGFGYGNGLGYNNFFNSAPPAAGSLRLGSVALLLACVFAMFCA